MNQLTDMDWGWWPFLSLRPPKNQKIDNLLLLKMALFYGSLMGLVVWLVCIVRSTRIGLNHAIYFLLGSWVIFFVGYKLSFAIMWNRRANRLRQEK
jgi:hypothetical protein